MIRLTGPTARRCVGVCTHHHTNVVSRTGRLTGTSASNWRSSSTRTPNDGIPQVALAYDRFTEMSHGGSGNGDDGNNRSTATSPYPPPPPPTSRIIKGSGGGGGGGRHQCPKVRILIVARGCALICLNPPRPHPVRRKRYFSPW